MCIKFAKAIADRCGMMYLMCMAKKLKSIVGKGLNGLGQSMTKITFSFDFYPTKSTYELTDFRQVLQRKPKNIQDAFRKDANNIAKDMRKALSMANESSR